MKILTILGARPQFIKAGNVSREIGKYKNLKETIVHTGQHYDTNMSDVFFEEMKIPKPDYFLGIGGSSHGSMTGQMIQKIEEVCLVEKPDWMLVYGDTNSTLAGAIAASKLPLRLAHVEAGLRSFNMNMPEEVNRILTDRVSDLHFCPTKTAVDNLEKEGFPFETANGKQKIIKSGDVMFDGALFYKKYAKKPHFGVKKSDFILCTIHRAENTDEHSRLKSIFDALNQIAKERQIVLPLHPRTKKNLTSDFSFHSNLTIVEPVGYLEMIWLLDNCSLVMTDSGGLQKEAYFFEKPCITFRDETEWVELVDNGYNILVGADYDKIIRAYRDSTSLRLEKTDIYGDGRASEKIVKELLK